MGYDVIGDIHGEAGRLEALLRRLGCVPRAGGWVPPQGRQVVFVGDLIDYGREQRKAVELVRSMIDAGHARCVLGNHELNAIGWATPSCVRPGEFLRPHTDAKRKHHAAFLDQAGEGSTEHLEMIEWFKTLPPMLDLGGIRVVHAWWHPASVARIEKQLASGGWTEDFLHAAFEKRSPEWSAIEGLTKGLEVKLPGGLDFKDRKGISRTEVRIGWWEEAPVTYRRGAVIDAEQRERLPDVPLPEGVLPDPVEGAPIFVGHYRLDGKPKRMSPKVACLDWSSAEGHPLVAYRWDGESTIDDRNFVAVK